MSHATRSSLEIPPEHSLNVPSSVGYDPEDEVRTQVKCPVARGGVHRRKKLVLCFDGTGNKFKGNSGDSNILKIFRMLDRTNGDQYHYYQPGIGTYITSSSLSRTSLPARVNSWYQKAKDSAVGTSFDQHVIGGYKFLMRYYSPGDEIYFFGFSRGAYTARFLAEMLDYVGLVTQGNEEMVLFAWKTFSRWQQRHGGDKKHQERKKELFNYMKAFRETFTRPVRRIRFLGLFDTVNSVPRFEAAWMQRNKFPYTARSTAKVIRHAVAIDERRAKFRQDLISQEGRRHAKAIVSCTHHHPLGHGHGDLHRPRRQSRAMENGGHLAIPIASKGKQESTTDNSSVRLARGNADDGYDSEREAASMRYRARSRSRVRPSRGSAVSMHDFSSNLSVSNISIEFPQRGPESDNDDTESDETQQDIEELWFAGGHADIGGGWDLADDEAPLSYPPLVWMVREARRAGLEFDEDKMGEMNCWDAELDGPNTIRRNSVMPQIQVSDANGPQKRSETSELTNGATDSASHDNPSKLRTAFYEAATRGKIHDCLSFGDGLSAGSVITWKIMEYLPFKRMDLQSDGSWKPIRFPLPRGEVRDIPDDVKIHNSVLRRMEADPKYRPGNLIVGGGGRGVRVAPEEYGMGEWVVVREQGNPVGEYLVKKNAQQKETNGN